MRILALVEGLNHVCCRYRLAAFAGALSDAGVTLTAEPWKRNLLDRVRQLQASRAYDGVIVQRKLLPVWQLQILRRNARRLVFDVDDAVFSRDSVSRKPARSWDRERRFRATVRAADLVLAGNAHLKARAVAFGCAARNTRVIPTCVSPADYPLARHDRAANDVRLVWIGQRSTVASLYAAGPCLVAAGARVPGLSLHVVSDEFPMLAGLQVVAHAWDGNREAAELARADIGVSWLAQHPWSLGKCGLKVLQYMAAGLPVVANPVGAHCDLVIHGRTGYLVESSDDWAHAIERLARDPELRRQMGAAARARVERCYSVASWSPRVAECLLQLCETPLARPSLMWGAA